MAPKPSLYIAHPCVLCGGDEHLNERGQPRLKHGAWRKVTRVVTAGAAGFFGASAVPQFYIGKTLINHDNVGWTWPASGPTSLQPVATAWACGRWQTPPWSTLHSGRAGHGTAIGAHEYAEAVRSTRGAIIQM